MFRNYYPTTCIVDCFEIRIQKPRDPDAQQRCYSNYKKCCTIKVFVASEPNGNVCFLSSMYQGAISNVENMKRCKFLENLALGSLVLASRGPQLVKLAAARYVTRVVPTSTSGGRGFCDNEVTQAYKIARVRIHMKRAIGRMKSWRELGGPILINTLERKARKIRVFAHLCKFLSAFVLRTMWSWKMLITAGLTDP